MDRDWQKLWDYQHPDESERRFRALLTRLDPSSDQAMIVQTQLARSLGLQQRFDDGHEVLDSIGGQGGETGVRIALERGRLFNSAGDKPAAYLHFLDALHCAGAASLPELEIDAIHMLAIAAPQDEQLAWNERALAIAESSKLPGAKRWTGSLLNNIGWTHHERGDFTVALAVFERAAVWFHQEGSEREADIADWAVARAFRSLGRVDEALAIHQRLKQKHSAGGETDPYVDEELGECLLLLGRAGEAAGHFKSSYAVLSTDLWLAENEPGRLARLQRLGS